MQTCPKCGHKFEEPDNGLLAPKIARAAIQAMGGTEAIGKTLAHQIEQAEDGSHRKMQLMAQLRGWTQDGDKVQVHAQRVSGIPEDQMKPILLEYAMQLLETDEEFQRKVLTVAGKRGLLAKITDGVLETECVRIGSV
jgi:hypothetical protein